MGSIYIKMQMYIYFNIIILDCRKTKPLIIFSKLDAGTRTRCGCAFEYHNLIILKHGALQNILNVVMHSEVFVLNYFRTFQ